MNHADAGNAPPLPADMLRHMASTEFQARSRHIHDGHEAGAIIEPEDFARHLGMSEEGFDLYRSTFTDVNGALLLPLGEDRYVNWVLGEEDLFGPAADAAAGRDEREAIAVIIPRLMFLRQLCDVHLKIDEHDTHYARIDGLIIGYLDTTAESGATITHVNVVEIITNRQAFAISFSGTVEDRRFVGACTVRDWSRGWEHRLF